MVYIYGGGYHTGSIFKITHDARYLAARGEVLVVMMNYRVGCLGWLYGGGGGDNGAAPANLGLADIHLALKWVHANGAHFGGDPSNVTLFGNSSGSVLTGLLLLSPATKGLFARVILQSGVPDSIRPAEEQLAVTRKFAKECGYEGGSSEAEMKEIVEFLKNKVSLETILAATKAMDNPFRPVYGADELVPVRPIEVLRSGRYNADVDILYGVCRDEGGKKDLFENKKNLSKMFLSTCFSSSYQQAPSPLTSVLSWTTRRLSLQSSEQRRSSRN